LILTDWVCEGKKSNMRIAILGLGLMGAKLGTIFARAGHEVVFSYARSNDRLKKPGLLKRFGPVMWFGFRPERSIGTELRHRQR
jgi:hypothetical protein